MTIKSYLTIAGIAHRRAVAVRSAIAAEAVAFPKGPDDLHLIQEVAICEAIIANARALISGQMLQLEFTFEGRSRAITPEALRGGDYDQGAHDEPFK